MKISLQKTVSILVLLLCTTFFLHAQETYIKGLVLNQEATAYFKAAGYNFLKIADDGTTLPTNDYKMRYNRKDGSVIISKHKDAPGKEKMVLLRGGADFFCTGCEEESCEIEKAKKGVGSIRNSVRYDCLGCYTADGGVERCEGSLLIRKVIYIDFLK